MAVGKKICMLGDFGVGKTSLVRRYVHDEFSPEYQTTLGVNIYKYTDHVPTAAGDVEFRHMLWDIEGGLQRESLLDSYIAGAAGAIVSPTAPSRPAAWSCSRLAALLASVRPCETANLPTMRAMATWDRPFSTSCGSTEAPSNRRPMGA